LFEIFRHVPFTPTEIVLRPVIEVLERSAATAPTNLIVRSLDRGGLDLVGIARGERDVTTAGDTRATVRQ
jgi:hypothetical protein